MSVVLPSVPAEHNVPTIRLVIKVSHECGGSVGENARLIYQMLGEFGRVTKLANVVLLGFFNLGVIPAQDFAIRLPRLKGEMGAGFVVAGLDFFCGDFGLVVHRPSIMPDSVKIARGKMKLFSRGRLLQTYAVGVKGEGLSPSPPRPALGRLDLHLGFNVQPADLDDVLGLDGKDLGRLGGLTLGGREQGQVMLLGDLHAIHIILHRGVMRGAGRDTAVVRVLVADDERKDLPLAPSEGLNLATLAVGDGLLDGGQIGEIDTRAIDARGHLDEVLALVFSRGLADGLEGEFDELSLFGLDGFKERGRIFVELDVGHTGDIIPNFLKIASP